jgi:hypothetical protein
VARGWNRETLRRVLEFQILWLRDVLRSRYGTDPDTLVNRDMRRRYCARRQRASMPVRFTAAAVLEEVAAAPSRAT